MTSPWGSTKNPLPEPTTTSAVIFDSPNGKRMGFIVVPSDCVSFFSDDVSRMVTTAGSECLTIDSLLFLKNSIYDVLYLFLTRVYRSISHMIPLKSENFGCYSMS